jgi:hypothetical protein
MQQTAVKSIVYFQSYSSSNCVNILLTHPVLTMLVHNNATSVAIGLNQSAILVLTYKIH